jgi:hypothetical protein
MGPTKMNKHAIITYALMDGPVVALLKMGEIWLAACEIHFGTGLPVSEIEDALWGIVFHE